MQRRTARERKDYLYRRAAILREAEISDKRRALRTALAAGRPALTGTLQDEALRADYKYDETVAQRSADDELALDDEYALSGVIDPRVLITTSRDPSSKLAGFAKELRLLIPTSIRMNRGNVTVDALAHSAKASSLSDITVLHEHRGVPTAITVSHLPHGPTAFFSLHGVTSRSEIPQALKGTVSETYPHIITEGFTTPLGRRTATILKSLFPPQDPINSRPCNRVITFRNEDDIIDVRHHVYVRVRNSVELAEVGPRICMRLFQIKAGSLENKEGDVEWALNQYTRTAGKKRAL